MGDKGKFSRLWQWVSGRRLAVRNMLYRTSNERDETIRESNNLKEEFVKLQQEYTDFRNSIEATNAQIARGQLGAYAGEMTKFRAQIQNYQQSERDIAERYGGEQSERLRLEKELRIVSEEYAHTDALLENKIRTLADRDKLIGFLRKAVHEKEEKIIVSQLENVCKFFDKYGCASVILVDPENKIMDCSDRVKEQLDCNGDFKGKPYYDLLNLEGTRTKEEIIEHFNNPRIQDVVVSVTSGKGKKIDVHIAKYPIFGLDRKHLMTIVTVSSVGFLMGRRKEIKGKRLEAQILAEIDKNHDEAIAEDIARKRAMQSKKVVRKAWEEVDKSIEESKKGFYKDHPKIPVSHQLGYPKNEGNKDSSV